MKSYQILTILILLEYTASSGVKIKQFDLNSHTINISLFNNQTLPKQVIKTYNDVPFQQPYGIVESCVEGEECFFYVTDGSLIIKLDANFSFIQKFDSQSPFPQFLDTTSTALYSIIFMSSFVFVYDFNLNLTNTFRLNQLSFITDLYFDDGKQLFYLSLMDTNGNHVMVTDEKFSSTQLVFDLEGTSAFLTGDDFRLYVGYNDNHLLIYDKETKKILTKLTLPCSNSINFRYSIDAMGHIAYSCLSENSLRLISSSGENLGDLININSPSSVLLDSKGRLIVTTRNDGLNVFY